MNYSEAHLQIQTKIMKMNHFTVTETIKTPSY